MPSNFIEWIFPKISQKACFLDIVREENKQILNLKEKRIYGEIQSKKVYSFFKEKIKSRKTRFSIRVKFQTSTEENIIQTEAFEVQCNFTSEQKTRIYLLPLLEHIFYFNFYSWEKIIPTNTKLRFTHIKDDNFSLGFINDDKYLCQDLETPKVELEPPEKEITGIIVKQRREIKNILKNKILNLDPYAFEKLIGFYFERMGYKDVNVTNRTKDGGIDVSALVKFGVNEIKVVIQAKRYKKTKVDPKTVRALRGALPEHEASHGIIITSSDFTSGAKEIAMKTQPFIQLISGEMIVEELIAKNIGIKKSKYGLIYIDEEFFNIIEAES